MVLAEVYRRWDSSYADPEHERAVSKYPTDHARGRQGIVLVL
jgi:hypothetical protein